MYIDLHWNANVTTFYQPGLIGTKDYITFPFDGTFGYGTFNSTPSYEGVTPAAEIPTRI